MKNKKVNLAIQGNEYHRNLITNILKNNNNYLIKDVNSKTETSNSVTYSIYGKGPQPHKNLKLWISKKNLLILHWIGTDVLNEISPDVHQKNHVKLYSYFWNILFKYKCKNKSLVNLAGAPWLVDELKSVGIEAKYLPITSINAQNLESFTDTERDIDVMSYLPYKKFEFYGGDKIIDLAKELPEYKFFILHPDLDEITPEIKSRYPENITPSPKINLEDMTKIYSRSKILLRLTEHDGLSLSVLEALFYKLHVFWTYPFSNTNLVKDYDQLKIDIVQNIENWVPNEKGHEYIKENFQTDKWEIQFKNIIDEIIFKIHK